MGVTLKQFDTLVAMHAGARRDLETFRRARDKAIVELLDAGMTTDLVAAHAGLTQPRVVQIHNAARAATGASQ